MTPRHRVSRTAIDLIKRFEGYRRKAARLPDGRWTIGYGHTLTARAGAEVSEQDAEALLLYDLIAVAHGVNERTYAPLNQNQFDALCAFAFNIGLENFHRSAVLRRINEGALLQGAAAMELWRKAQFEGQCIVIDALVRRRSAEKALFLTPADEAWIPAPSPVLPPQLDMDVDGLVPREVPVALISSLEGDHVELRREVRETAPGKPFTPREDEGQSPVQKAATSVTARLQNFFRAPERRAPATHLPADFGRVDGAEALIAPSHAAAAARMAGELQLELTPPDEEEGLPPRPAARPRLEVVAANEAAPGLFDGQYSSANDQTVLAEPVADPPAPPAAPEAPASRPAPVGSRPGLGVLLALAGAGFALFAGSLCWAFNAWGGAQASLLGRAAVWIACIAGIAGFSLAAYLMLERLGRASGDLGEE